MSQPYQAGSQAAALCDRLLRSCRSQTVLLASAWQARAHNCTSASMLTPVSCRLPMPGMRNPLQQPSRPEPASGAPGGGPSLDAPLGRAEFLRLQAEMRRHASAAGRVRPRSRSRSPPSRGISPNSRWAAYLVLMSRSGRVILCYSLEAGASGQLLCMQSLKFAGSRAKCSQVAPLQRPVCCLQAQRSTCA